MSTDKVIMPRIGLGTWKTVRTEVMSAVTTSIELGYRHIDCAPVYNNEREVGAALQQVIQGGIVEREQLWVTSKLWNNAHKAQHVRPALERSLKDLQLDYLDLFLIHWPVHFRCDIMFPKSADQFIPFEDIPLMETWQAMEKMVKKGLCRHIGVCNFNLPLLRQLVDQATIPPFTNQIELHPFLPQKKMIEYCLEQGIIPTAYAPLGSGDRPDKMKHDGEPTLLNHPELLICAHEENRTPAQLLLSWSLDRGCTVIPKSTHPAHLAENLETLHYKPAPETKKRLATLDCGYRFVDGSFFTPAYSPYSLESLWAEELRDKDKP